MGDWYDKAELQLGESLENGDISEEEYHEEMKNLNEELRQSAEDKAQEAYNDEMGCW